MKRSVDIEVVLDDKYVDPRVTIKTRTNTQQVENIIYAIENATNSDFPQVAVTIDDELVFIPQNEIVRILEQEGSVLLQTANDTYTIRRTLSGLEDILDPSVFLRISQSEIINMERVKSFSLNMSGTIGVEFDCGIQSWVSRNRVKQIKALLSKSSAAGK